MYLFDTDVLSNLMKPSPSDALVVRISRAAPEEQFTSSITVGELAHGARRMGGRATALVERIENLVLLDLPVLPFDTAAAWRYGEIRAELERRGTPIISDADIRIASIALSRGLKVITGNERHFRRVPGLEIENWLEG